MVRQDGLGPSSAASLVLLELGNLISQAMNGRTDFIVLIPHLADGFKENILASRRLQARGKVLWAVRGHPGAPR